MNKLIADMLDQERNVVNSQLAFYRHIEDLLASFDLPLSDTVNFYIWSHSNTLVFYVYNRADLQALMTLASLWNKEPERNMLKYTATMQSDTKPYINVKIYATDAALPPTCKVVTEEVLVPAAEAYTATRERIVCDI